MNLFRSPGVVDVEEMWAPVGVGLRPEQEGDARQAEAGLGLFETPHLGGQLDLSSSGPVLRLSSPDIL